MRPAAAQQICFSSGCFPSPSNTTVQTPAATRLQAAQAITPADTAQCSAAGLPELSSIGGDAFLAALAATLNVYRDRVDNAPCASADPDYLDSLVVPPDATIANSTSTGCNCLKLSTLLSSTNAALADVVESPYTTDTSSAIPLVRPGAPPCFLPIWW